MAGLCQPYLYRRYLVRWLAHVPAAKTLVVAEEPWEDVKVALMGFFGANGTLPDPVGHSSGKWPRPAALAALAPFFADDWAGLFPFLRDRGVRTVADFLPPERTPTLAQR